MLWMDCSARDVDGFNCVPELFFRAGHLVIQGVEPLLLSVILDDMVLMFLVRSGILVLLGLVFPSSSSLSSISCAASVGTLLKTSS